MRSVHASGRKRSCSTLTSSRLLRTTSTCDVPFTSTSTNDSSAPTSEVVTLELRWNEQHLAGAQSSRIVEIVYFGEGPPGGRGPKLLGGEQINRVARVDDTDPSGASGA